MIIVALNIIQKATYLKNYFLHEFSLGCTSYFQIFVSCQMSQEIPVTPLDIPTLLHSIVFNNKQSIGILNELFQLFCWLSVYEIEVIHSLPFEVCMCFYNQAHLKKLKENTLKILNYIFFGVVDSYCITHLKVWFPNTTFVVWEYRNPKRSVIVKEG